MRVSSVVMVPGLVWTAEAPPGHLVTWAHSSQVSGRHRSRHCRSRQEIQRQDVRPQHHHHDGQQKHGYMMKAARMAEETIKKQIRYVRIFVFVTNNFVIYHSTKIDTLLMYMCTMYHWTLLLPRSGLRLCPDQPTSILISSDSSGGSYLHNN